MNKKQVLDHIEEVLKLLPNSVSRGMGICCASYSVGGIYTRGYSHIKTIMKCDEVRDYARKLGGTPGADYWFERGELKKRIQVLNFIKERVENGEG